MVRITFELIPQGNESKKEVIGTFEISNIGSYQAESGVTRADYIGTFKGKFENGNEITKTGSITGFPKNHLNIYHLAKNFINRMFPDWIA